MTTLTEANAKNGTAIVNNHHPEWGVWTMRFENNFWTISNGRGAKVLDEAEFKFWNVVREA